MQRSTMGLIFSLLISCLLSIPLQGCSRKTNGPKASAKRPGHWARRLEGPGLSNLHQVSRILYRGAQPSHRGMQHLESLGIKTIINLRRYHSDDDELKGTRLKSIHIRFNTVKPKVEHVVRFLKAALHPDNQPVYVHCQHGSDRTGTMVAFYRIVLQGWSKTEAIREMTKGGFRFHSIWRHLPKFVRQADIEGIRKAIGLAADPAARPAAARPAAALPAAAR